MSDARAKPEGIDPLGNFLCFSIYSTNLAFSRVYKPVLEALGLTYPQYVTLIALFEEDNQTVKGLSERLFLEPSTMTPMLKRLEGMGYVTRTRGVEDERIVRIALTEAGREVRKKGVQFNDVVIKATGLTMEQFINLQATVTELRTNLAAAARGDG